ncbi:MAG: lipocalin-like domain-containing protein [Burkholderiales bacterium]|nr:lipocalin-like domain-containing protein [Burkholderiales bacterium]
MWTRIAAILGILLIAMPTANADDREKLVGVWKMISWEIEFQDTGERKTPFGKDVNGYLIFTREGRAMIIVEGEGRKAPKSDAERVTAFQTMVAYSGIDRIEGDKWIVTVDTAWNPAWKGTVQTRSFKLTGDRLDVVNQWQPNVNLGGKISRAILAWERVR